MDYDVPGGTDQEGWQYAADFPTYVVIMFSGCDKKARRRVALTDLAPRRTFHGHKAMKDFVRRRRWTR